ncbi:MAG: lipoyl(octanoyl) transferase LipB [Bacteroidota bacterium]|nr:lipoyl(octanoyl) transferase LipB [Flammeovirgaceae bacterium]MCZ8070873.1 lipoyl(octanoyl) transferase LipB [Cytophagales bacterium]
MNILKNHNTNLIDLGLIEYQKAWDYQTQLFNRILEIKKENRDKPAEEQQPTTNYLLFCEHPHVFTLGKSGEEKNLLIKKEALATIGAAYYHINRGGDITYHGPGQIVVYPIFDLENFFTDIHQYMRLLEESVIQTLKELGIDSGRIKGLTGVWLGEGEQARKICALGVKSSRWVTMHGLAFNVNTNLRYFDYIVPCGIDDKAVTSVAKELGGLADIASIKSQLLRKLESLFELQLT